MRVKFECYSCILKQLLELARQSGKDDDTRMKVANELLGHLCTVGEVSTPPELAAHFWGGVFERETGICDPMAEVKDRSTVLGLELLEPMRKIAEESENCFNTALRLAIGGNIIDFGVNPKFDLNEAKQEILDVLDQPFDYDAAADLHGRMKKARNILYILDNCGEAVLDRLVMEPFREKITVGVRGRPILNDDTRSEAAASGIDAPLVDTGDGAPGVSLRRSSPEFLDALNRADLVVAKGQGNFESLEGEFDGPIYFLLRAKCEVVARHLDVPIGSIVITGRNLESV